MGTLGSLLGFFRGVPLAIFIILSVAWILAVHFYVRNEGGYAIIKRGLDEWRRERAQSERPAKSPEQRRLERWFYTRIFGSFLLAMVGTTLILLQLGSFSRWLRIAFLISGIACFAVVSLLGISASKRRW
jgi:hypothetical protein